VNRRAGQGSARVGEDTYAVLSAGLEYGALSGGLFDVTVGPLLSIWRKARREAQPPCAPAVESAAALVDYTDLVLDPGRRTARLRRAGQALDLGGIGKGYAADRALEIHRERGVSSAFVNLGGNVGTVGAKPDGGPWRIGIRHPQEAGGVLGLVSVTEKSVVTSGSYERWFEGPDGSRYHHILDPATGRPSESGLASVTIVAESSITADALSTIVFLAGLTDGLDIVRSLPLIEAVLVDADMRVFVTPGLRHSFEVARGVDAVFA